LKPLGLNFKDIDQQLEQAISLGDISGIFKAKEKRVKSAPNNEKEKRIAAQKVYADKLREENKIKETARQQILKEKAEIAKLEIEKQPIIAKAASEDPLSRVPHASNRFQG